MSIVRGERNAGCLELPRNFDFMDRDNLEHMIADGKWYDKRFVLVRIVYIALY